MAPQTQSAVVTQKAGSSAEVQFVKDWPVPQRKEGDVLIQVHGTSVNPVDILFRNGVFGADVPFPKVQGSDVSGIIEEADANSKFKKGDRVIAYNGLAPPGTFAEFTTVLAAYVAPAPQSLPLDQAGVIPLVGLTAMQALEAGKPQPGQRVLIQAGAGGVGHILVQLAKKHFGLYVVATASAANAQFVKDLGADEVIDYRSQKFEEVYKDQPFDMAVDCMGGEVERKTYSVLKPTGHLSEILNHASNRDLVPQWTEAAAKGQGPGYTGIFLQPNAAHLELLVQLIDEGKLHVTVGQSFPLERTADALDAIEKGSPRGKILVKVK